MAAALQTDSSIVTQIVPKQDSRDAQSPSSRADTVVGSQEKSSTTDGQLSEVHGAALSLPVPTLSQSFAESVKQYADNIALVSMHQADGLIPIDFPRSIPRLPVSNRSYIRWTHSQLQYASEVFAFGLKMQGLERGQPIATLLYNGVEWCIAARAAAILGCPFVPLNPRVVVNLKEVEHMLDVSGARALLVVDLEMAQKLQDGLPDVMKAMAVKSVVSREQLLIPNGWSRFNDIVSKGKNPDPKKSVPMADEESPCIIIFTSGTTALPKGVMLTNKGFGSSLQSHIQVLELDSGSRTCCHMPNHHIGGLALLTSFMLVGGSVVFPSASFDPGSSLEAISQEQCTNVPCVPTILQALAGHPKIASIDTKSMRNVELGATTILPENLNQAFKLLKPRTVSVAFGMSEGTPISFRFYYPGKHQSSSAGMVSPGAKVRICYPDTKTPVRRGDTGEIHLSGPMVIKGYLRGASPDSFYSDEVGYWLRSGDQGVLAPNGELTVAGRYKDIIIRGGENIAPAAIEAILDTQLGVTAQVVGVRSEEAGELPVAVIQPKEIAIPTSAIRKAILEALGVGFVPERVYTLQNLNLKDFPKTSSGKIRKVELKAVVQKHEDAIEAAEAETITTQASRDLQERLSVIWRRIVDIDTEQIEADSQFSDFADSLTMMRFRSRIKRDLGLDITVEDLLAAGTIQGLAAYLSSIAATPAIADLQIHRDGPPQTDDMAITLGDPDIALEIETEVRKTIEPYGFTWEDDVEDVLPCWNLGHEVFGSVVGVAKVNHRMIFSMKTASVQQVRSAISKVLEFHAMQRSFELRGVNGEPTMRVVMRANRRWMDYSIFEIPAVETSEELVALINDGTHFSEVVQPYPSFLLKIAHIKSTNSAGIIWALQHSAFDGISAFSFLEDLDSVLGDPSVPVKPHVPYKLWADAYYLYRSSLAAQRSIGYQVRRLKGLESLSKNLFPLAREDEGISGLVTQRRSFISKMLFTDLLHVSELKTKHQIPAFIVVKAALAMFLAHQTKSSTALFSQNENGRSWPFQENWIQNQLPQCMDLAGPCLERTIQLTWIDADETVLQLLQRFQDDQEASAAHVHAPWSLVRKRLGGKGSSVFDSAAERTCLNWLPIRTRNGVVSFNNMRYHDTKANCESWFLFNCGMEDKKKMWVQVYGDEDRVPVPVAEKWARMIMNAVTWLSNMDTWDKKVESFVF